MVFLADDGALHERILHVDSLFVPFRSGHFFILVQAIKYLLNFHVNFIDILNARVNFAGRTRLEGVHGIIFWSRLDFWSLLLLYFHWIFNLAEFFHEIRIFLAVVTESRNMLGLFPSTSILVVLFGVIIRVVWLFLFEDVGWGNRISQGVPVGCVGIVGWRFGLRLFWSLIIAIMRIVLAVGGGIVFFFDLFYSHISPTVTWFPRSVIRLWLWFRVIFGSSHRNPGDLIEAVLSFHFNNKTIILLY